MTRRIQAADVKAEHEKLIVYERAVARAAMLEILAATLARRRSDLADQLRRASASVPLNIAEGAGEFSPKEKARYYRIALRSATECMAVLDLAHRIDPTIARDSLGELREIASMLTAMVKQVERR